MVYILDDKNITTKPPEIDYGYGTGLALKNGLFFIDEADHKVHIFNGIITFEGEQYEIKKRLKFSNRIQGEITFLKLKMVEFKDSSASHFYPITFKKYVARLHELFDEYPEFAI